MTYAKVAVIAQQLVFSPKAFAKSEAFFFNFGRFASDAVAQVVEARAHRDGFAFDLDFLDIGGVDKANFKIGDGVHAARKK